MPMDQFVKHVMVGLGLLGLAFLGALGLGIPPHVLIHGAMLLIHQIATH
jgi:hypothetical protein